VRAISSVDKTDFLAMLIQTYIWELGGDKNVHHRKYICVITHASFFVLFWPPLLQDGGTRKVKLSSSQRLGLWTPIATWWHRGKKTMDKYGGLQPVIVRWKITTFNR
jgi:hypothetical protein